MSLRERLLAVADDGTAAIAAGKRLHATPNELFRDCALAAARLALEEAARECAAVMEFKKSAANSINEREGRNALLDQYIGASHCEARVRALAEGLD